MNKSISIKTNIVISEVSVFRGGSWGNDVPGSLAASARLRYPPPFRNDLLGFRCMRRMK